MDLVDQGTRRFSLRRRNFLSWSILLTRLSVQGTKSEWVYSERKSIFSKAAAVRKKAKGGKGGGASKQEKRAIWTWPEFTVCVLNSLACKTWIDGWLATYRFLRSAQSGVRLTDRGSWAHFPIIERFRNSHFTDRITYGQSVKLICNFEFRVSSAQLYVCVWCTPWFFKVENNSLELTRIFRIYLLTQ